MENETMSDGITDGARATANALAEEDELTVWLASTPEQHEELTLTITRRQAEILLDEMTPRGCNYAGFIYDRMLSEERYAMSDETWKLSDMLSGLTGKGTHPFQNKG